MGKFDGILLVSDLDGTLCDQGKVSSQNSQAIRYFQSEGGLFSIASGRQPNWLLQWKNDFIPNTWSSMLNGAIICDANGENFVFEQPVDSDIVELTQTIRSACPKLEWVMFCGCNEHSAPILQNAQIDPTVLPSTIYKCLVRVPDEFSDEYTETVRRILSPNYICMRSWINGIEYQKVGTGKGDSILRLKKLLGKAARLTVAVGNYENDCDMIKAADIGYAVGDAIPSAKACANRITVPCAEHAIAKIIDDLERLDASRLR